MRKPKELHAELVNIVKEVKEFEGYFGDHAEETALMSNRFTDTIRCLEEAEDELRQLVIVQERYLVLK